MTSDRSALLRLALHTQPQVRVGARRLVPQNMQPAPERLVYLDGMVRYLNLMLAQLGAVGPNTITIEQLAALRGKLPFGDDLVEIATRGKKLVARAAAGAADALTFDRDRVTIAFPDGRRRHALANIVLPTGAATPAFARAMPGLLRGATRTQVARDAARTAIDIGAILDQLLAHDVLEEIAPRDRRADERVPDADRVTWLGHAALAFEGGGRRVWLDPVLPPQLAWRPDDRMTLFSPAHAESRLFHSYGTGIRQRSIHELPLPDVVCVTHQDADHLDPGLLMMLPRCVPIVVPRASNERGWEVDIARLLHDLLGADREVVVLPHGESFTTGDLRITAFPFRGEMPATLPHDWNCYLFETSRSAVACTADARISSSEVEFLGQRLGGSGKPFALFSGPPRDVALAPGWREGLASTQLYTDNRLYSWFAPLWSMFHPVPYTNVSYAQLGRLAKQAGLRWFFPYAMGSTPWCRIADRSDPFCAMVSSMTAADLDRIATRLRRLSPRVELLPLHYGDPWRLDGPPLARRRAHGPIQRQHHRPHA